jgi:hypothetical protein
MGPDYTPGLGAGPHPGATPIAEEPPAQVTALAHQHQLGPRLASRRLANPVLVATISLVAAAASLGLLILLSSIGSDIDGGVLRSVVRFAALFLCFGFVGLLAYGIAALARGAQSFHVYAGGFIHRRNSKLRAFAWPEIVELRPVVGKRGDTAGKIQHYRLTPRAGKPIAIPLDIQGGRDEFMDHLMAALRHHGVPVH